MFYLLNTILCVSGGEEEEDRANKTQNTTVARVDITSKELSECRYFPNYIVKKLCWIKNYQN